MKKLIAILLSFVGVSSAINIPVHYDTLGNGMRILIVPDTNVAVVSCRLYYFVGSMYEGPGTSGLSHMFEHMMFKGTSTLGTKNYKKEKQYMAKIDSVAEIMQKKMTNGLSASDTEIVQLRKNIQSILNEQRKYIKKDEIWELYLNNGGTHLNAWTADDMTAYMVTLPMNKLELFYWIESDRMRDPVLREFYSERDVVMEERRMRYENKPLNRYYERLWSLFYVANPYRLPTIGWMSDIQAYTRTKLQNHVKRFYTPDNAVLILVGNVDVEKAMNQIRAYFGKIPRAKNPKVEVVTREPKPIGETRFSVVDDAQPRIDLIFHTPGYPNKDLYALDVVEQVLSGNSGRLQKRLVNKEKLCISTGAGNAYKIHDGSFHIWANLKNGTDPNEVEKIIFEEINNLAQNGPTKSELERVRNSIRLSFTKQVQDLEGLSNQLAFFERLGSWKNMLTYPDKISAVKSDEIPNVIHKYITKKTMTIGTLTKKQ